MDDYDDMMPRHAPEPVPFIEATAKPTVPEVSLLFDQGNSNHPSPNRSIVSKTPECNKVQRNTTVDATPTEPYNVWRFKTMSRQNEVIGNGQHTEMNKMPNGFISQEKDFMNRNGYHNINRPDQNYGMPQPGINHHYFLEPRHQFKEGFSDPLLQGHTEFKDPLLPTPQFNHSPKDVAATSNNPPFQQVSHSRHIGLHENQPRIRSSDLSHTHLKPNEFTEKYQKKPELDIYEVLQRSYATPNYYNTHSQNRNDQITKGKGAYQPTENNQCRFIGHLNHDSRTSNPNNYLCFPTQNSNNAYGCENYCEDRLHDKHNSKSCGCKPVGDSNLPGSCDSQNFIKDMINIIQTQNDQISKLQDQIKQLIQLHSECYKVNDTADKIKYDSPKLNSRKIKQTKTHSSKNLSVIEENSDIDEPHVQDRSVSKTTVGLRTNLDKKDSERLNSPKDCHNCDRQNAPMPPKTVMDSGKKKPLFHQNVASGSRPKQKLNRNERLSDHGSRQGVDQSFTLDEADLAIPTITEQIPSPTTSVHVDMHEYNSSSSESSDDSDVSSEGRQSPDPQVSWTFYNNVVGQVNNILKKKPVTKPPTNSVEPVRHLTVEQLRKMGIVISDVDNTISKKVTFDAKNAPYFELDDKNETDITMHFNALGLHRMNDDYISKYPDKKQDFRKFSMGNGNTSLSFATLHYLERHHLLPNDQDLLHHQHPTTSKDPYTHKKKKSKKKTRDTDTRKKTTSRNTVPSKILDITTLKQQPKLI